MASLISLESYYESVEIKPELLAKEKQFEESLRNFYRQKWNCQLKAPVINGKSVNLYKLYASVSSKGGWIKVSNQERWSEVAEEMGYAENVAMIDNGIKLIYMRYLSKYEEVQTVGEIDDHDTDIYGGGKSRSKMYFHFASGDCPVALAYREKKTEIFENEYTKIVKSLYSGLPNEVDFALNILTVMSNPGPHILKLEKCPFLLNLAIAHAGVYGDDKEMQSLAEEGWKSFCDRKFEEFWVNSEISDDQVLDYIPIKSKMLKDSAPTSTYEFDPTNATCFRILQVTSILRNLSFETINIASMGKSDILIKFMCVCAASKHVRLVNDALDILSNIGHEIDLMNSAGMYSNVMLLKIISDCLQSDDKNKVLHSLEIIAGLCQNEKNESVCAEFMDSLMLERIFRLVTVKDILICIHTLETLYQFSELGRASCNKIISVPNSIELLISLLTNDAASFGRTGLSGIQVVESLGSSTGRQHYPPPPPSTATTSSYRPPQYTPQLQPTHPPPRTVHHSVQRIHHAPPQPVQPLSSSISLDEKLKTLTTKWIKDNIVAEEGSMALRGEMYSACVDHLKEKHSIMSGTVNLFTQILQSLFPNTQLHSDQRDNKLNYYIDGVRYLKQSNNKTVASSHPLMQKILATPKSITKTPSISPPQMNGSTSNESENKTSAKESSETIVPKNETAENLSTTPSTDLPSNGVENNGAVTSESFEAEDMIEENSNDGVDDAKLEACSEYDVASSVLLDEEHDEIPIVRIENPKIDALIEDEEEIVDEKPPKKRVNGLILNNAEDSCNMDNLTNGICNGTKSKENMKENGHNAECSGIHDEEEEAMDFEEESTHNGEGESLPECDPAKIDETVEAVSKVPPTKNSSTKNGKLNSAVPASEEVLTNGKGKKRKAATPKTGKKKVAKNSNSTGAQKIASEAANAPTTSFELEFMCEWNACGKMFSSADAVSSHIIQSHLTDESKNEDNTFLCMWPNCNKTRRAKWSLVTHFQDHHCAEPLLRQSAAKRAEMGGAILYLAAIKQQFDERMHEPEIIPTYAQAAAMDAIRRHSQAHFQREFTDEQEGPVTKCIRLTTALILRNIARFSEEGRCKLRQFELQICPLALSRLESASSLLQCLTEINNTASFLPSIQSNTNQVPPQTEHVFAIPYPRR